MATTISLEGLQSGVTGEERAIALLKVELDGIVYDWSVYVPVNTTDLNAFIEAVKPVVTAEIQYKEAQWVALTPKTREVTDPITGETTTVDINKNEVVHPEMPDYYALRRAEYPAIGDHLDSIWKGEVSNSFAQMVAKIQAVKNKYPKPSWM